MVMELYISISKMDVNSTMLADNEKNGFEMFVDNYHYNTKCY